MKKIAISLMMIITSIVFIGCDKDENKLESKPQPEFNLENIKQTGWKGTITVRSSIDTTVTNTSILFITEKTGNFELSGGTRGGFNYYLNEKLLAINGPYASAMGGDWMLIEFTGDKLLMKEQMFSETYNKTLELTRDY